MASDKKEDQDDTAAATTIQAVWRSRQVRKDLHRQEVAAGVIQRLFRRRRERLEERRIDQAQTAERVLNVARRKRALRLLRREEEKVELRGKPAAYLDGWERTKAAKTIQRAWISRRERLNRVNRVRPSQKTKERAAVTIQRAYRAHAQGGEETKEGGGGAAMKKMTTAPTNEDDMRDEILAGGVSWLDVEKDRRLELQAELEKRWRVRSATLRSQGGGRGTTTAESAERAREAALSRLQEYKSNSYFSPSPALHSAQHGAALAFSRLTRGNCSVRLSELDEGRRADDIPEPPRSRMGDAYRTFRHLLEETEQEARGFSAGISAASYTGQLAIAKLPKAAVEMNESVQAADRETWREW